MAIPRLAIICTFDASWHGKPNVGMPTLLAEGTQASGMHRELRVTKRSPQVTAPPEIDRNRHREPPGTLGDLLYADRTKSRIPEKEWVEIVQAIAAGDQAALRALYDRSHRIVFSLIMRITKNRATAEELTLDVFHDVWRRASQYDAANGPVLGWLMNQARSRAIDRLRYEQRRKRVNPHAVDSMPASQSSDCDDDLDRERLGNRVRNALAVLTADERAVIEAAYFSELTYAEVAVRLDQPLGTVKTRIRSGLRKLRRSLAADEEEH
jgi:RNA polymerase sigma-70 factor (ECF subfamily)